MLYQTIIPDTTTIKDVIPQKKISIENRRFLGNKFKLVSFIKEVVEDNCKDVKVICDIFSGTGVVGHYLSTPDNKVIFNDILKSSTIPITAFSLVTDYNSKKIEEYTAKLNTLSAQDDNYFSLNFGNKYFTTEIARKIGSVRELIEKFNLSEQEKSILLTSLLYAADKIANTVGHYDAFYSKLELDRKLILKILNINTENNANNEVRNEDANTLIRNLKDVDLLYLDPPYNSRQYSDTYHLLENLIRWEKPNVYGKASKMDRGELKSRYCFKDAIDAFTDLINNAHCRYIIMSYNNTGDKRDQRSNNRISHEQIIDVLRKKGEVEIYERDYKAFNSGKTQAEYIHKEFLYYCKVG